MLAVEVADRVRQFIVDEFLEGDDRDLSHDSPLLEWGIIDSLGMNQLIVFLEDQFRVRIAASDLTPTNFHSLERISTLVVRTSLRPPASQSDDPADNDPELLELLEFGATRTFTSLASGARLHAVQVTGPEPTWLVLPEPGRKAASYGGILRALEGLHRTLAPDLPGFGLSTCVNPEPTFWDHAALLSEWLRAQPMGSYVLVGHGLSAALALELALRVPDRVRSVIALGFGGRRAASALLGSADGAEACTPACTASRHCSHRPTHPAAAHFLDTEAAIYLPRLLAATTVPTLFIGGLQDLSIAACDVEHAAEAVAGAQVQWLARTGHAFPIERADETVSLMLGFQRDLGRSADTFDPNHEYGAAK